MLHPFRDHARTLDACCTLAVQLFDDPIQHEHLLCGCLPIDGLPVKHQIFESLRKMVSQHIVEGEQTGRGRFVHVDGESKIGRYKLKNKGDRHDDNRVPRT